MQKNLNLAGSQEKNCSTDSHQTGCAGYGKTCRGHVFWKDDQVAEEKSKGAVFFKGGQAERSNRVAMQEP